MHKTRQRTGQSNPTCRCPCTNTSAGIACLGCIRTWVDLLYLGDVQVRQGLHHPRRQHLGRVPMPLSNVHTHTHTFVWLIGCHGYDENLCGTPVRPSTCCCHTHHGHAPSNTTQCRQTRTSLPWSPLPHVNTFPSLESAHVWLHPHVTCSGVMMVSHNNVSHKTPDQDALHSIPSFS